MSEIALFIRLLKEQEKADVIKMAVAVYRSGGMDPHLFEAEPEEFRQVPGAPFSYWVSDAVRRLFKIHPAFETKTRTIAFLVYLWATVYNNNKHFLRAL